jgi:hypothetical protein
VAIIELAIAYMTIVNAQKALVLEEKVLAVQKSTLGAEHRDTLLTAGNLAESYRRLRRHKEAMELGEKVLEARRKVLGPEDADNFPQSH